jgi:hypothetical protein
MKKKRGLCPRTPKVYRLVFSKGEGADGHKKSGDGTLCRPHTPFQTSLRRSVRSSALTYPPQTEKRESFCASLECLANARGFIPLTLAFKLAPTLDRLRMMQLVQIHRAFKIADASAQDIWACEAVAGAEILLPICVGQHLCSPFNSGQSS